MSQPVTAAQFRTVRRQQIIVKQSASMNMKIILIIGSLCLGLSPIRGFPGVLYSNDFETSFPGFGWAKAGSYTTSNDAAFYASLAISASIQKSGGNRYEEAVMTVPTIPSSPNTRWYGGVSLSLIPSADVPGDWSLSFDVRESSGDPLQIRLYLDNGQELTPEYMCWATPSSGDWSPVTINSSSCQFNPFGTDFNQDTTAQLFIFMASHDSTGNPLALSNVGTYTLDVDNVVLSSVPEPGSILLLSATTLVLLCKRQPNRSVSLPNKVRGCVKTPAERA